MKVKDLVQHVLHTEVLVDVVNNRWEPVRPITRENFTFPARLKAAWKVLTNKADIVEWEK